MPVAKSPDPPIGSAQPVWRYGWTPTSRLVPVTGRAAGKALDQWTESGTRNRCLDCGLGRARRVRRLSARRRCLLGLGRSGGPLVMHE